MPNPLPVPARPPSLPRRLLLGLLAASVFVNAVPLSAAADADPGQIDRALLDEGSALAYRRAISAAKPSTDTESARRLRGISVRILTTAETLTGIKPGAAPAVTVIVAETADLRLFPGARILATTPFVRQFKDEEIAAVLAQIVALRLHDGPAALQDYARLDQLRSPDPNRRALAVADAVEHAMQNLKASPEQTAEADALSTRITARAGYDPRGAGTAWRRLGEEGGPLVRLQPVTAARLEALDAAALNAVPDYELARVPSRPPRSPAPQSTTKRKIK